MDQYAVEVEHRYLDGREWRSRTVRSPDDELSHAGLPVTMTVAAVYELVER